MTARSRSAIGAVATIFFKHFLGTQRGTVYKDPDLYEAGAMSRYSRRPNLARGVADVVERSYGFSQGFALDIGAGTGIYSAELASRGFTVVGLDCLPAPLRRLMQQVESSRTESNIAPVLADMNLDWPFADAVFDLVTSLRATRYIRDFDRFIDQVSRVLRPGGVFVFPVFAVRKLGNPVSFRTTRLSWLISMFSPR